jgi:hypothetical protein
MNAGPGLYPCKQTVVCKQTAILRAFYPGPQLLAVPSENSRRDSRPANSKNEKYFHRRTVCSNAFVLH